MFGMGMPEILMILAVALIVIGPKKLPELARTLGRAMNEFKQATQDFKQSLEIDYDLHDVRKPFEEVRDELSKPLELKKRLAEPGDSSADKPSEKLQNKTEADGASRERETVQNGTDLSAKADASAETPCPPATENDETPPDAD